MPQSSILKKFQTNGLKFNEEISVLHMKIEWMKRWKDSLFFSMQTNDMEKLFGNCITAISLRIEEMMREVNHLSFGKEKKNHLDETAWLGPRLYMPRDACTTINRDNNTHNERENAVKSKKKKALIKESLWSITVNNDATIKLWSKLLLAFFLPPLPPFITIIPFPINYTFFL